MSVERIKRAPAFRKGIIIRRKTHLIAMIRRMRKNLDIEYVKWTSCESYANNRLSGSILYQATGMAIPHLVELSDKYKRQGYNISMDTATVEFMDEIVDEVCGF